MRFRGFWFMINPWTLLWGDVGDGSSDLHHSTHRSNVHPRLGYRNGAANLLPSVRLRLGRAPKQC
jgi:hypothetical protein